ncbi:hypothetical protein DHOM_05040 [Dermabacter hominis 1368]|uniref:Uncharacterized protein n=1 Tax=Dermabacter hominis 1368 TaxID=1450519 RepID=A0ABR4SP44_9MICO|nr:hypothetical protein DHOM_05040 [Dermabacter hominis 1368]
MESNRQMSRTQLETLNAEMRLSAMSEDLMEREEREIREWEENPRRWALPMPDGAKDPADQMFHHSELPRLSWMLPKWVQREFPQTYLTMLDRLWGVLHIEGEELPMTITDVRFPKDPAEEVKVRTVEREIDAVEGLRVMMRQVQEAYDATPEEDAVIDRALRNLEIQMEVFRTQYPDLI